MPSPRAGLVASLQLMIAGCSIANRIDVCDRRPAPDFQVNARGEDDQYLAPAIALTRLANGLYAAVWTHEREASISAARQVRAGLFRADGAPVVACNSAQNEVTVSDDADFAASSPAINASPDPSSPIYIVWQSRSREADPQRGPYAIRSRIFNAQLCPVSPPLSLSSGGSTLNAAPVVAARADGREALAVWIGLRSSGDFAVLARPFGVSVDIGGRVEPNGCDNADRPCEVATAAQVVRVALAAVSDGYVAAWTSTTATAISRFELSWVRATSGARPIARGVLTEQIDDLGMQYLALTAHRGGWALAWSAHSLPTIAERRDSDVWVRRFSADNVSTADAQRANDRVDGVQGSVALASLGEQGLFVSWTDLGFDGRGGEVRGAVLDERGQSLFNAMACDRDSFAISTQQVGRRASPSLAAAGDELVAIFHDTSMTGTDAFGYAVRGRSFSIRALLGRAR